MISVSTVWNVDRHGKLVFMFEELANAGFSNFELAWITEEKYRQIKDKDVQKLISGRISSMHNFVPDCPELPEGRWKGNVYRLTAPDEAERKKAVIYTNRTIENAADLGAKAVVIHIGEPEYIDDMSHGLTKMAREGKIGTPEFLAKRDFIRKERERVIKPFWDIALFSLDEINRKAVELKVLLGIETRLYYEEIPDLPQVKELFARFKGGAFRYWHDIGHAEAQERLGFSNSLEYLETFEKELIGLHIHDMTNFHDHEAPGQGTIDYKKYAKYLKNDKLIKVFEIHPKPSLEELVKGRELIEQI